MIQLKTKGGTIVDVPESIDEDPTPSFSAGQLDEAKVYFDLNGYAVIRNLIDPKDCDRVRSLWNDLIKPSTGVIFRQSGDPLARHIKNENGWIMNPALDPHSMPQPEFRPFREAIVEQVFDTPAFAGSLRHLLRGSPLIVQSMYFEGNSATQEHQDSYYLDAEKVGELVAAWVALEDIRPRAGRFFVSPGSHSTDRCNVSGRNADDRHQTFIETIMRELQNLPIHAPVMRKGDVLFWHPLTIHGSMDSTDPEHSRSSLTCHAIRHDERLLERRTRSFRLSREKRAHLSIHYPQHPLSTLSKLRRSLQKAIASR